MKSQLPPGYKRAAITVHAETWEKLQAIARKAGLAPGWLSEAIDGFLPGLLKVMEQAEKDAENRKEMTDQEASFRYAQLMAKEMNKRK